MVSWMNAKVPYIFRCISMPYNDSMLLKITEKVYGKVKKKSIVLSSGIRAPEKKTLLFAIK